MQAPPRDPGLIPALANATLLLALWSCGGEGTPPASPDAAALPAGAGGSAGAQLFQEHCAACHGEEGDGLGTTDLAVGARSFKQGHFTWGNTPEALARTVRDGLAGRSPMPAFEDVLTEDQIRAVVEHVRTLIPQERAVDPSETRMRADERPVVVRGGLPPSGEAGVAMPRGLMLGFPGGLSLSYRADDVRLIAARQGDFVERRDWSGRGGAPLEPLGELVHLFGAGDPPPAFERGGPAGPTPLRARLSGSFVRGETAGLSYKLQGEDEKTLATVEEVVLPTRMASGLGYRRLLSIEGEGLDTLYLRVPLSGHHAYTATLPVGEVGWLLQRPSGGADLVAASAPLLAGGGSDLRLAIELSPEGTRSIALVCQWLPPGSAAPLADLEQELAH